MHWEDRYRQRAEMQHGLVASFQLSALRCDRETWRSARRNGRWKIRSDRVIALNGYPETDDQRVLAAVLDASPCAVLHGRSTLAWLDVGPFDLRTLRVARPRFLNGAPNSLAELHRLRTLRAKDVTVVRGVPTETALRAIWAEAGRYARPGLEDLGAMRIGSLLDGAHRRHLLTWAALADSVDDLQVRGRSGTRLMRALSAVRPPGSSPTETRQEDRLEEVLDQAGKRPLRRQPWVGGDEPIGRTDHRDDRLPLVVETNSLTFHTTPSDQAADELRYERLTEAGFTVAVVWENDLWKRPRTAVETVTEGRRHAAGRAIVIHSPGCPWSAPRFGDAAAIEAAKEWDRRLAS
jgi:hypothetical protein